MARFGVKQIRKFTASIRIIPGKKSKRIAVIFPGLKR